MVTASPVEREVWRLLAEVPDPEIPILNVIELGVVRYVRDLEEALIRTLADFGVAGTRLAGLTGVWVGSRKLAAIGVRISIRSTSSSGLKPAILSGTLRNGN